MQNKMNHCCTIRSICLENDACGDHCAIAELSHTSPKSVLCVEKRKGVDI